MFIQLHLYWFIETAVCNNLSSFVKIIFFNYLYEAHNVREGSDKSARSVCAGSALSFRLRSQSSSFKQLQAARESGGRCRFPEKDREVDIFFLCCCFRDSPYWTATMVCGGFICTKNSLCALNIVYVVSRILSCWHEMQPYVAEMSGWKVRWLRFCVPAGERQKFNTSTGLVQRFQCLRTTLFATGGGQVLVAQPD